MSSFEECYLTVLKKNSNKMLGCDKITAVFNLGELRFQYHSLSRFQQCRSSDYRMPAYRWLSRSAGLPVPETAIVGGRDIDGSTIYVGKAYHEGDLLPAKVIPEKNVAYVCHNGEEHPKSEFEVLCQSEYAWEFCSNGSIPADAVVGGETCDGETLYIGRVLHKGSQTVGKVQPSHGCLYIPFDGEELSFKDYEVLTVR
ncbi:natterin-3-like [Vespula maculifrons]|uniref:Natterin-3-like n=1 Tax=Vespula maculifrons TaxID=7453 RepID=A0ABD2B062_VESMC